MVLLVSFGFTVAMNSIYELSDCYYCFRTVSLSLFPFVSLGHGQNEGCENWIFSHFSYCVCAQQVNGDSASRFGFQLASSAAVVAIVACWLCFSGCVCNACWLVGLLGLVGWLACVEEFFGYPILWLFPVMLLTIDDDNNDYYSRTKTTTTVEFSFIKAVLTRLMRVWRYRQPKKSSSNPSSYNR